MGFPVTRQQQFRENLREMVSRRGLTQKEAAKEIGIRWNWFRKACSDGIARVTPRNQKVLQQIAKFFGLARTRLLWSPRLFETHNPVLEVVPLEEHFQMLREICYISKAKGEQLKRRIEKTWLSVNQGLAGKARKFFGQLEEEGFFDDGSDNEINKLEDNPFDNLVSPDVEKDETPAGGQMEFYVDPTDREIPEPADEPLDDSGPVDDDLEGFDICNYCGAHTEVRELLDYDGVCETCHGRGVSRSVRRMKDDSRGFTAE